MPIFSSHSSSKPRSLSTFLSKFLSLDHRHKGGNIQDDWEYILDRDLASDEDDNLPIKADQNDDFSEDGFSNFSFSPPTHYVKAKYKILSKAEVRQCLEDKINEVSTILLLPRNDAAILLQHFKWDVDRITDEWLTCEKKVREAVGLFLRPVVGTPATDTNQRRNIIACTLCQVGFPTYFLSSVSCGHRICYYCWEDYIGEAIEDGPRCLALRCPVSSCDAAVGPVSPMDFMFSEDLMEKFENHLLRSFLSYNYDTHKGKWCPAPDCDYAVFSPYGEGGDVTCQCLHRFCWNCTSEAHAPVDCGTLAKWMSEIVSQSENWVLANTTKCPYCKVVIEKVSSFEYVVCNVCKHRFCSACGDDWFNQVENECTHTCKASVQNDGLRSLAKNSLARYNDYYNGWSICESNRANALTDLKLLQECQLGLLCNVFGISPEDLDFVVDALRQVVECWQCLKWTYVYGYYMPEYEQAKKHLFEFMQDEAARLVRQLHKHVEDLHNAAEDHCPSARFLELRSKIIKLTRVIRHYFDRLIEGLKSGLAEVVSIPPFNPRQDRPTFPCLSTMSGGAIVEGEPIISSPVSSKNSDMWFEQLSSA